MLSEPSIYSFLPGIFLFYFPHYLDVHGNDSGISIQVYEDTSEGRKVCTYYKLDSIPVVLVIDPITGQKMRFWSGMVQPESLLEVSITIYW